MAVWKGAALVETETGGLLGASRWWAVSTDNSDPTGDQTIWDADAGAAITLYFRQGTSGAVTPNQADTITVTAHNRSGALITTLYSGPPPATGTSWTFYCNSTGASGGDDRAGGAEIRIRSQYDGITGDYDIYSSGTATIGAVSNWSLGLLRANAKITGMTRTAYPAGSTFAYGPAADETILISVNHTIPWTTSGATINLDILDGSDVQSARGGQTYDDALSTSSFLVNDIFDSTANTYGIRVTMVSDMLAPHIPTSGNVPAMLFIPTGTGLTQGASSTVVEYLNWFDVGPRIYMGTPTTGESLYNRGENSTIDVGLTNARGESLTRSMSFQLKDSLGAVKYSVTDTGTNYDINYTIGVSDDAADNFVGSQWTLNTNQSDIEFNPTANVFFVSRKLMYGSAVGLNDLDITTDYAIYNRNESPQISFYVSFARGVKYDSRNLTIDVKNTANNAIEDSQTITTDTNGQISYNYLISNTDAAANDLVGVPKYFTSAYNGNTTTQSANEFSVSNYYYVDLHTQLSGTLNKDDFPSEDANENYDFVILGDIVYAWVHVEGVRNDGTEINTSGSSIILTIKNPSLSIEDTILVDTDSDGWTPSVSLNPSAPAGDWTYIADVDYNGNTGADTETITYITPLTSNLSTGLEGPVLIPPGHTIRCWFVPEIDDAPVVPQTLPVYRVESLSGNTTPIAETNMFNEVDDTQSINGSRYYFDLVAPTTPGRYVIYTRCQLNGNGIRKNTDFRVGAAKLDPSGLYRGVD